MIVQPVVFFFLILAVCVLALTLGFVVSHHEKVVKKPPQTIPNDNKLADSLGEKSIAMLDEARDKALKIIQDANSKAEAMLTDAQLTKQSMKSTSETTLADITTAQRQQLDRVAKEVLATHQKMLDEVKADNVNIFRNISKDIEKQSMDEVKNFREILEKETIGSEKIVAEKIEKDYLQMKQELSLYKANKFKQLDSMVNQVLQSVAKQVIGKTLNLRDHQDLVIAALEKAKKEGVFTNA
jgi:F0F1-type ATP synthase membrane subunit b/b'